jgi:hypothetical protein
MRTFLAAVALMAGTIVAVSYLRGDTAENPDATVAVAPDVTRPPDVAARTSAPAPPAWRKSVAPDAAGVCPDGYTALPHTPPRDDVTCVLPPALLMARESGLVFVTRPADAGARSAVLPAFLRRACRDRPADIPEDRPTTTLRFAVLCHLRPGATLKVAPGGS